MGFTHEAHLVHMTWFMSYDWVWYVAQLTLKSQLMDFTLCVTGMDTGWFRVSFDTQYVL